MHWVEVLFIALIGSQAVGYAIAASDCPKYCPEITDPVCGSDGIIYGSECELKRRNCGNPVVAKSSLRYCSMNKVSTCQAYCYDNYDPVCGSNGIVFRNKCHFALESCRTGIRFAHAGACRNLSEPERCPTACPPTKYIKDKPVCASDGNVYPSECEMKLQTCGQKVVKTSFKNCQTTRHCEDQCRKWYDPICGSDGRIYSNACLMKQQNCGKHVYQVPMVYCLGQERNKYGCPTSCRYQENQTVCATDGNIYNSECEMRMLNCGNFGEDVAPTSVSFCQDRLDKCGQMSCGGIFQPVCGSDGRTYTNDCEYKLSECRKGITRSHEGICHNFSIPEICPKECPKSFDDPVCGSDGNVYKNACEMKRKTCGQRIVPVKMTMCRMTAYCDITCPVGRVVRPVCASDGNLYKSECHMFSKNCGKHIFEVPLVHCLQGRRLGCKEYCPPTLKPVCGTDGKVYANTCFLRIETCRTKGKIRQDSTNSCGIPAQFVTP